MSTNGRYSGRLRTRGNANAGNDATTATAAAAATSRTALGNIANRERKETDNEPKPKKIKSMPAKIVREEKSEATLGPNPKPEKLPAASTSEGGKENDKDITEISTREAAAKKAATTKKGMLAHKESKPRNGGIKRSSGDGNISQPQRGRSTKRARKSDDVVAADEPVMSRRVTRSQSEPSRKKSSILRATTVDVIRADVDHVVPKDFALERSSFNGHNFTHGIAHYDASERMDPLLCKDYVTDMFQQLYHAETQSHPKPYMDRQADINEKMRAILVDWLVEVHMKFRLVPDTLYLCVNIIDRYCSIAKVSRTKLQLLGVTSLFLACKHEEIYPPEVRDCVYITDRAYDRQEVLDMEQTILRVLNWRISLPTAYPFLDRFLCLTKASPMTRHTATFYLERTLQEHDLLKYRPSMVCASAVILALNNIDIPKHEEGVDHELPGLPKILMEYTGFDADQLWKCMKLIADKVSEPAICASKRHLTAVKKKYEHKKYMSVSLVLRPPNILNVQWNDEKARKQANNSS
ncbi:hypothetical protein ACHAXA_002513 [Cyclostephanos tholiformis]|uniref:Uncharacterized protein n=1 Tax=Cyclostephanos tholiformis TaxID=382380 RepID=A0ABD3SDE9_9STRA